MAYRNGFQPVSTLGGGQTFTQLVRVNAGANNAFFIGDPVYLVSGKLTPVTASAGNYVGVIHAVYGLSGDGNKPKPLTFNQPTRGPYLVTAQEGYAQVCFDSNQTYIAQLDVSASAGLIGKTVNVSAGAPNTAAGISGYNLKGTTLSTSADNPFKIVGIAPTELVAGYGRDLPAGSAVLVKMNFNVFSQTAGV